MREVKDCITEEAPEFIYEKLAELEKGGGADIAAHPYLQSDAPRWMYDKLAEIEGNGEMFRKECMADYQLKDVTWLFQLDGIRKNKPQEPKPDYHLSSNYQLANCAWNVRLYIAPGTTQEQAITLAKGLVRNLEGIWEEDYIDAMTPYGPPRIKACTNESYTVVTEGS